MIWRYCSPECRKGKPNAEPNAIANAEHASRVGEDVGKDIGGQTLAPTVGESDDDTVVPEQLPIRVYFNRYLVQ